MPIAAGADPRSFPPIAQLFSKHGYAEVDAASLDAFVQRDGHALLLFTEDPVRVRETLDLAVIVPEIEQAFAGRLRIGVALPAAARELQPRFGFRRWPAFVIFSDGRCAGAVDGLRDWDEYLASVSALLNPRGADA
jgi:hydrogenase-1 operon protein HyaE